MSVSSRDLLRARDEGARIETSQGCDVGYFPRHRGDRLPWLMKGWPDEIRYRRSSAECRAVTPTGGGPWSVARLLP